MPKLPFFGYPNFFYRNYRSYPYYQNISPRSNANRYNNSVFTSPESIHINKSTLNGIDKTIEEPFLEILGLKLYSDDILILSLIFFLYTEDVKDEGLFIALVLLLLS